MNQGELLEIFNKIKKLLKKYEKPLEAKFDMEGKYDLWSAKDIEIEGRKKKEIYFAGLIVQSNYVGFYYMPVYTDVKLEEVFPSELLALKKGKSCFHIRSLNKELEKQIKEVLETGYKLYKKRGWI